MRSVFPLVLLAALTVCTPASAAVVGATEHQVTRQGGKYQDQDYTATVVSVSVTAGPGERNQLRAVVSGFAVTLTDSAGLTAAAGCVQRAPTEVTCALVDGLEGFTANLGDEDDTGELVNIPGELDGGPGDDTLRADHGNVVGGPGDDHLRGGGRLEGGPGADVMRGAAVNNGGYGATAFYGERTEGVTVTPGTGPDDGAPGEGDDVGGEIGQVVGGGGDDTLRLGDRAGRLAGGGGSDDLEGSAYDDELEGGDGEDVLRGGAGDDKLYGGGGHDVVDGGDGDDRLLNAEPIDAAPYDRASADGDDLSGGPGADLILGGVGPDVIDPGAGRDHVEGGGGEDAIDARDAGVDLITCADRTRPAGEARADRSDLVRGCARLDRAGTGYARALLFGPHELDENVGVAIGCPQDVRPRCRVDIRLGRGRATVAHRVVNIPEGSARQFALMVNRARLRRLTQQRAPKGQPRFCSTRALRLSIGTHNAAGRRVRLTYPVRTGSSGLACDLGFLDTYETGWD